MFSFSTGSELYVTSAERYVFETKSNYYLEQGE
jgi:hypothetical protein